MAEKNKEDSLFLLVKSLNKAEKRYIKINSTHTIGEKNNYMRLFEALDSCNEYDDTKFRQKFKKEPFIKYLAAEKNYLYELILKSLRAYRADRSRYMKLLGLIQDIDLLYEKKLYEECDKRIRKAQKIALDFDYFHINAMLIDWKYILLTNIAEDDVGNVLDLYNNEINGNLEKSRNYYIYRQLKNEAIVISKKYLKVLPESDKNKLDMILRSDYVINPDLADSFLAKHEYYTLLGRIYNAKLQYEEEHQVRKKLMQLFLDNPEMIEEYPDKYDYAIAGFLAVSVRVNDFEGYQKAIEMLGLGNNPEHFKEMKIINMGGNQMFYLMNYSRWKEAEQLSNVLEDMIIKYRTSISWTQVITIKYNAGCLKFIMGNFSDAVDRFDYVINEKQETYMGQLLASRILHLICHYEISPPTVVEYLLGSAQRFATKIQDKNEFNSIILKGIRKLNKTIDKSETKRIMAQLKEDLLEVFEEYQFGLGLEETICWLISRLENRSILDVVNERLEIERQMAVEKLKQQENQDKPS